MNTKSTTGHRHDWHLAACITLFMLVPTVQARTVTVNVSGMTCEVCVVDLQRKLSILPQVKAVHINLKKIKCA